MIRNHTASLRRDIVGIGLCALVGLFALTKAPVSVAELVSDEPLSFNVRSMPVAELVGLIVKAFGPRDRPSEVTGLEQLGDIPVTAQMKGVPAREGLQQILNCAGFTYRENGDTIAIVPLEVPQAGASACSAGMRLD